MHPRPDCHALHEVLPIHHAIDGIQLALKLEPRAKRPHVVRNRRAHQIGVLRHVQNKRRQLASPLAVVREDEAGPAIARTNHIPMSKRRLDRTVRRRAKPRVHDLVHLVCHALVRQAHEHRSPAIRHAERKVLLRAWRAVLIRIRGIGITQLAYRAASRVPPQKHAGRQKVSLRHQAQESRLAIDP